MHLLKIVRDLYTAQTTLGKLYITPEGGEEEYFCETLEDTVRPSGIKVKEHTAIPSGVMYKVGIRYSPGFKRDMLVLYTEEDGETIDVDGAQWKYCMFHGGNRHDQTEGCPLVAFTRLDEKTIQKTAEKILFAKVKSLMETCEVRAVFTNMRQSE